MQVAYAIACVVVHQRAHQLIARPGPVPVGEMLFAIGFTSRLKVFRSLLHWYLRVPGALSRRLSLIHESVIWCPRPSVVSPGYRWNVTRE